MGLLETLFDTAGRRKRQAEDLREKIAALEVEHRSAVVGGDDAATDRVFAKLEKLRGELKAVDAAIDAAERSSKAAQEAAAAEVRGQAQAEFVGALETAREAAMGFSDAVKSVVAHWRQYRDAVDTAATKARAAGVEPASASFVMKPLRVWNLVWWHFTGLVQRNDGEPLLLPQGGSKSRQLDTVEDHVARERRGEKAEA